MKYSIIKKITGIVLLGFIFDSCSDDILDFQPIAAENSSSFYLTMSQAEQAVTAAYSTLAHIANWDRDVVMIFGDVPSDDCESGGDFENEVPNFEEFNRMTHLPSNNSLRDVYGVLFRGVYFSNLAMEKISNVVNTDPNADAGLIEKRLGELKFLRALNYLYLTHIYGEVPFVDHVLGAEEYNQPRSAFRALFDLIESDLKSAISVLPERWPSVSIDETRKLRLGADVGRATKGAAKALLARMYLFESSYARNYPGDSRFEGLRERWDEALDYSEQVINSGEYNLVGIEGDTFNTWWGPNTNGYRYIFTVEGDNCLESIFEIQYIQDLLGYGYTRAGSLVQWTSARWCLKGTEPSRTPYWGLGWPTESLASSFETGDPRFKVAIATEGDSIEVSEGERYPIYFDNYHCPTGYYQRKYELAGSQFQDLLRGWHNSPYNIKLIRLGEVYLNAAEAAFMLNDNAKALNYINTVRTRARNCGNTGVPTDLTGNVTFEQLVNERRVELSCEGHRFFDLVRWNLAKQYIDGSTTAGGFPIVFESPKNDFMPLPANEVSLSGGVLKQYSGW
jgi:hypothetical protein